MSERYLIPYAGQTAQPHLKPEAKAEAWRHERGWTDKRIEQLKFMLADGASRGDIAKELGITRGAVSGKADRLGISSPDGFHTKIRKTRFRNRTSKRVLKDTRLRNKQATKRDHQDDALAPRLPGWMRGSMRTEPPPPTKSPVVPEPQSKLATVVDLNDKNCHWPGEDGPLWTFCAQDAVPGLSYCLHHALRAYPNFTIEQANVLIERGRA